LPGPATEVKPVIAGLLDRQGPPAEGAPVQGFVVNANWADLQPTGPDDLVTTLIDSQLAEAQRRHLPVKLRLYAGIDAPDWLKAMTGPPVTVSDPVSGVAGTIGRYWIAPFGTAYNNLIVRLAARYDETPELREVNVSRCSTIFSETFLRNARAPENTLALVAAGLTVQKDEQCIKEEIDASKVWRLTRTGIAFNPFQAVQADGTTSIDEAFTQRMMDYCRQSLGGRCVLENNSLRSPPLPDYVAMYSYMRKLGRPIEFQTAALSRVGDLTATIRLAITLGASAVELPAGYDPGALSDPSIASALQKNAG